MKKEITNIGNLLDSKADIICHQVNASKAFGSGVAGAIKKKYPRVCQKYMEACTNGLVKLGTCQVVKTNPGKLDNRLVANLCGQETYGYDGKRYTNYEGLYVALEKLASYCKEHKITSIAFPWKMSSGSAGGDWFIVAAMIESVFKNNDDITIEYWKLEK